MKRRLLQAFLLLFVLPALACNLPASPAAPTVDINLAVRQTLAALETEQVENFPLPAQETPQPLTTGEVLTVPTEVAATVAVPTAPHPAGDHYAYVTQPGDTPEGLAGRFGVAVEQLFDPMQVPPKTLLTSGQALVIPNTLKDAQAFGPLFPDSEMVYSPAALGFSTSDFVNQAGGFLSEYSENLDGEMLTGAQVIQRVADETSTNPRMLLAVLEYRSNWVFGRPERPNTNYPIGFYASKMSGLHKEMTIVARQLTIGYYGWRSGKVTELEFLKGTRARINPTINAGTVGVQYLFAVLYEPAEWQARLYGPDNFLTFYQQRFGDPWVRSEVVGPVLPDGITQPELQLPFPPGESWTFTGGPHAAWGIGSPWGGLDFAPANVEKGCTVSRFWTTAAASGQVVRSERGMVILDLDGDGSEQTGWVLLYLHVAAKDRVPSGTFVNVDDPLGHPSCEGGTSTGTHVHISRKYNGEWLAADTPLPFILSGWQAWTGLRPYSGSLTRGDQVVTARPDGARTSIIVR